MTADEASRGTLEDIRRSIEQEDRASLARAKAGIILRGAMLLLMVAYMAWLSGTVDRLSAVELTRFAAGHPESRLPDLRAELRDYAIDGKPLFPDKKTGLEKIVNDDRWHDRDWVLARTEGAVVIITTDGRVLRRFELRRKLMGFCNSCNAFR